MRQRILRFLKSDNSFHITKILKQHWRQSKYSYKGMPRPDFGIMIVLSGSAHFVIGEERITATAGNVVFLPKGSQYEAIFPDETDDYLVSFDSDGEDINVLFPTKIIERAPFYCIERFSEFVSESVSESHTALRSKGLFYLLIDSFVNAVDAENDSHRKLIAQARELLYNGELSVSEVAKKCAVSESSLRCIFKEETGMSPMEYRLYARLRKAAYLLESTDMSVCEVSNKLGFFDAAYFCKIFKKHMGITPKQYSHNKEI